MKLPTTTRLAAAAIISMSSLVQAETKAEFDQRLGWFREARFGMFIHWGLYSVPAGEWKGRKFDSNVEWIQSHAQIPVSEYTPLKDRFNPSKYDPEAWVKLAKDAGMKYIVITTKHHDGFCLWDSKQTEWDIASTPYGKDLLKPLAAACAKHGIKLCFYHSIMDWHHPQWGNKAEWRGQREGTPVSSCEVIRLQSPIIYEFISDHTHFPKASKIPHAPTTYHEIHPALLLRDPRHS